MLPRLRPFLQNISTSHLVWVLFCAFAVLRLWNAWHFNPYWGYDGGNHLDYIRSLAFQGTFPSIETNDVAWHEPLYYFIFAAIAKLITLFTTNSLLLLKFLSISQALLSLVTSYVVWLLLKELTKKRFVLISSFVLLNVLPSFWQLSMMITNELLNQLWLFVIISLTVRLLKASSLKPKELFLFGIVGGLALITKITAIVPLMVAVFALIWRWYSSLDRTKRATCLMSFLLPLLLIPLPWYLHRSNTSFASPSINNTRLLAPKPLALDSRIRFFTNIDLDLFRFPYWYSGGRSFWSMIYADTFIDYYAISENQDLKPTLNNETGVRISHIANSYIPRESVLLSTIGLRAGLPLLALLLYGCIELFRRAWKKETLSQFGLALTTSLFLALIYFSYRYPYPDMGTVKLIYIFPVVLFPTVYGLEGFSTIRSYSIFWKGLITLALIAYSIPITLLLLAHPFNY